MPELASRLEAAEAREKQAQVDLDALRESRRRALTAEVWSIWDETDRTEHEFGSDALRQMLVDFPDLGNDKAWDTANSTLRTLRGRREAMGKPNEILGHKGLLKAFPKLERARWQYMIPDAAWQMWPTYDRVLVFQVPQLFARRKLGSSGLLAASEVTQEREHRTSCEGIVIAAGLQALDHLRSNGVELGDRVAFIQNYLYRRRIGYSGVSEEQYVGVMRSGDVCGSFELADKLNDGWEVIDQSNLLDHCFQSLGRKDGATAPRQQD